MVCVACIGAIATSFCTFFAVIVIVLCAFVGAESAHFLADTEEFMSDFRVPFERARSE